MCMSKGENRKENILFLLFKNHYKMQIYRLLNKYLFMMFFYMQKTAQDNVFIIKKNVFLHPQKR